RTPKLIGASSKRRPWTSRSRLAGTTPRMPTHWCVRPERSRQRRRSDPEGVADAAHGPDQPRPVGLELRAQVADVTLDHVHVVAVEAPHTAEQLSFRDHAAGLLGQRREERELERREV